MPSFYGYEHAAKSVGAEICCHELLETDGYAVTERFLTAIGKDVDAVFLAVPNNPVGTVGGAGTVGEDCGAMSEERRDLDSGRMFCDVHRRGRTLFLLKSIGIIREL